MLLVLPACGDDEGPQRFEFERVLMGTPMRVALYAPDKQTATAAVEDTFARVERIEAAISSWQEDSEVRRLERRDWSGGDPVQISGPVYWCIRIGLEFAKESEGAFDVTAQPLIALWRKARKTRELPSAEALRKARSRVGSWQVNLDERMFEISLRPGVRFDFGAVGKGFALSEAASELSEWQLPSYMIQFGGEIAIGKPPPGRVGWRVQVPGWPEVLELSSCAVATSGSSEQYVEIDGVRYAHVLDARTG
ncbi:MAG: FAD:protein FMN transferase, partial [Planctomycetota bacterium]|nr:FAD:protein FMN transferase [Planctomycetota bacterium]